MTDEDMVIRLGGKEWTLKQLPWRYTKEVHPTLRLVYKRLLEALHDPEVILDEKDLTAMGDAVFKVISTVDPKLTKEQFEDLPMSISDMNGCLPAISRALGLRPVQAGAEAPANEGK